MNKRGFTLIELVIVIILLGLLSAVALPRFLDLSTDAKRAINQDIAGSLGSAVSANVKLQVPNSALRASANGFTLQAINIDPTNPSGAYHLFTASVISPYPIGATSTKITSSSLGTDASQAPWTMNMANNTNFQQACTNIFNTLLSENSLQAANDTSAAYQTVDVNFAVNNIVPTLMIQGTNVNVVSTVNSSSGCLWLRSDSLTSTPVFYIYYYTLTGEVMAFEAPQPPKLQPIVASVTF